MDATRDDIGGGTQGKERQREKDFALFTEQHIHESKGNKRKKKKRIRERKKREEKEKSFADLLHIVVDCI